MTAVMETAVLPDRFRAEALRKAGAALGLINTVEEFLRGQQRIATAFERLRLVNAAEEFLRANEAAREASERARLADTGGWGGFDNEAERLHAEAENAWVRIESGVRVAGPTSNGWGRNLLLFEEVESAGVDYMGRRRRRSGHDFAVVQSGPCDWTRGR